MTPIRVLVLPFGLEPREQLDQTDFVVSGTLGRDLSRRLSLHGQLDAGYVDPLAESKGGGVWLYNRDLVTELVPPLVMRLDLDAVVFVEASFGAAEITLTAWLFGANTDVDTELSVSGPPDLILETNIELTRLIHEHYGADPAAHELDRIESVATRSLDALRYFSMASVLPPETDEAALQRLDLLARAVHADHDFAEAIQMLSDASRELGDPDAALDVLEDYAAANDEEPEALLRLGETALSVGRLERAVEVARKIVEADPWNERALILLGEALLASRQPAEAAFMAHEAVWRFPQQPALRFVLARSHLALGEFAEADDALSGLHESYPDDAAVTLFWCRAMAACGRFTTAMQHLKILVRTANPEDVERIEARLVLAEIQLAWGTPGQALATINDIDPVSTHGAQADAQRSVALLALGHRFEVADVDVESTLESGEPWALVAAIEMLLAGTDASSPNAQLDTAETLVSAYREQAAAAPGDSALAALQIAQFEVELAIRRDALNEAETLIREQRPEVRVGIMNRLAWLVARATQQHDTETMARTLAVKRAIQPRSVALAVQAAWLGFRAGAREASLALLDDVGAVEEPQLIRARTEMLVALGRGEEALDWLEACRGEPSIVGAMQMQAAAAVDDSEAFDRGEASLWSGEGGALPAAVIEDLLEAVPELGPRILATSMQVADETPSDPRRQALAIRLLLSAGDAEGACRVAADLKPGPDAHVAFVLGLVASARGQQGKARTLWETAIAEGGHAALDAAIHLGALLISEGQTTRALEVLEWAFVVFPGEAASSALLQKAAASILVA